MEISLAELRSVMYQGTSANKQTLREPTFFAALRSKEYDADALSELFHENSKFRREITQAEADGNDDDERLWKYVEANTRPDYPGHRFVQLPDASPGSTRLVDALERRRSRRQYAGSPLSIELLSTMLKRACGVTTSAEVDADRSDDLSIRYRAYPSPGALYPIEVYPIALNCGGLEDGVYYYVPEEHGLRVLRIEDADLPARVAEFLSFSQETLNSEAANVLFVLSASFWRVYPKYGDRGYRYALQESGHIAQNILLVAESLGLNSVPIGGFYDDELHAFLDLDGVNEAVVYIVPVGDRPRSG